MWISYEKYTTAGNFRIIQQTQNTMIQFFGGFESVICTPRKESIDLVLDVEVLLYLVSLLFKLSPKGFSHSQLSKKGRHADPRRRSVSESV